MIKFIKIAILLFIDLFFLIACFDYKERITFNDDFSGTMSIDYVVFLSKKENSSLLGFLPTTKEGVLKQYEKLILTKKAQLTGLSFQSVEKELKSKKKQRGIRVSYTIAFRNPVVIESSPLQNTKVIQNSNRRLEIRRSFPTLSKKEWKNIVTKRIIKYITKKFSNHSISYETHFPDGYIVTSNKGKFSSKINHSFSLFLKKTLLPSENIDWSFLLEKP